MVSLAVYGTINSASSVQPEDVEVPAAAGVPAWIDWLAVTGTWWAEVETIADGAAETGTDNEEDGADSTWDKGVDAATGVVTAAT